MVAKFSRPGIPEIDVVTPDDIEGLATKADIEWIAETVADHEVRLAALLKRIVALEPVPQSQPPVVTPPVVLPTGATPMAIYPPRTAELESAWGVSPRAVMELWGAPVYAPDRKTWYFFNGGHNDCGLSMVVASDEKSYTLLIPPSPLDPKTWQPISGPPTCHTRGGMKWYSSKTRKAYFAFMGEPFSYNRPKDAPAEGRQLWELDIDTAAWTRLADYPEDASCVMANPAWWELPSGKLRIFVSTYYPAKRCMTVDFDPVTKQWDKGVWVSGDQLSAGCGVFDQTDRTLWFNSTSTGVYKLVENPDGSPGKLVKVSLPVPGLVEHSFWQPCGKYVYAWNQATPDRMLRMDKATGKWAILTGLSLPTGRGHGYNGLRTENGNFVASYGEQGFKTIPIPPEDAAWQPIETIRPEKAQSYIDAAKSGDTVTIPAGTYGDALVIAKGLDVHLTGVTLLGIAQDKANIVVSATEKVRLYDHTCLGVSGDQSAAAVRDSGQACDIELYNVRYANCPNGVEIGNASASKLLIDGGLIEKMTGTDKSHGIYMGRGDTLILRGGLTISGQGISQLFGHLCKSRAQTTSIDGSCILDGGNGHYSRLVDLPCGGTATLAGTFHHGPNSDNADMFSYAVEPTNCIDDQGIQRCDVPGSFIFTGTLTSDRSTTNFGVYRGAPGTVVKIDKTGLPAGLPMGTFPG